MTGILQIYAQERIRHHYKMKQIQATTFHKPKNNYMRWKYNPNTGERL